MNKKLQSQLNKVIDMHRELEHDMQRYAALSAKATRAQAQLEMDKVLTSPTNKAEVILAMVADLSAQIDERFEELQQHKRVLQRIADRSGLTREEMMVFKYRYINCFTWADISTFTYWSERKVYKVHDAMVEKLIEGAKK